MDEALVKLRRARTHGRSDRRQVGAHGRASERSRPGRVVQMSPKDASEGVSDLGVSRADVRTAAAVEAGRGDFRRHCSRGGDDKVAVTQPEGN